MTLSDERRVIINRPGSINHLNARITAEKINIDTGELMSMLPAYIMNLTEIQQTVFKAHYLRQLTIGEIRALFGFRSVNDVERALASGTEKIITMIKMDYGVIQVS
jgi:hypothetical protein